MVRRPDWTLLTGPSGTIVVVASESDDAWEDPFEFILEAA
jgi:hypothetical protein